MSGPPLPPVLERCTVAEVLADLADLPAAELPHALWLFTLLFRHLADHHRRHPATPDAVYRVAAALAARDPEAGLAALPAADRGRAATLAAELVTVADGFARSQRALGRTAIDRVRLALARALGRA